MRRMRTFAFLCLVTFILPALQACAAHDGISGADGAPGSPAERELDAAKYFNELEGTAVFYQSRENTYYVYNRVLADKQSSPCSSFKIVSCLAGLETGIIDLEDSVMKWSGTKYPMDSWNQDMDFRQAFRSSCVWYFRRVIDAVGKNTIQDTLDRLNYGNRDISRWEGGLDNKIFPDTNNYKELNGFWLESSLLISPRQQVDVMKRIFGDKSGFSDKNLDLMKEVMLVDNGNNPISIYGKTGSGAGDESWADAWFVGLFEKESEMTYFAVRLNQPGILGFRAKEIAIAIINGEFGGKPAQPK